MTTNCRLCGKRSYLSDDTGPVHPCCALNGVVGPNGRCPACSASAAYTGNYYSRKARAAETAARAPQKGRRR